MNNNGRHCFVGTAALDPRARLADSPLLPGAVLSVGGPGPDYHPVRGGAVGTLHVTDGPDAGFGVALGPGRHVIGRSAGAPVSLRDSEVSREHAVIEVSRDGTAVISDAGSQNGTLVNGVPITRPTPLNGIAVRIGPDKLRWDPAGPRALRATQVDGRLAFDRVFAAIPAIPAEEVNLPPGEAPPRGLASLIATAGGLATGPVLYAATGARNLVMLAPSALGVLLPLAGYALDGRQRRKASRAIARAREAARDQAEALAAEEERIRHLLAPGPAEVVAMARGARPDLWSRDAQSPNGLVLRAGVTDQAPSARLRGEPWEGFHLPALHDVPVSLDLRETGVLGVLGAGERARALLRWLIVQLAALRCPGDLRLVFLTAGDSQDLGWVRWLPHLDPGGTLPVPCLIGNTGASRAARIDELTKLIEARLGEGGGSSGPAAGEEVVVILDGALALRNLPGIGDVLKRGPEAGVYALCADRQGMAECRGACEVTEAGIRLLRTRDARFVTAVPDGMDAAQAERVARALAPMRDRMPAAAEQAIPYPVRLLDLLDIGVPTAEDILARWRGKREGPATRVILGAGASGPVTVDLEGQGPHTMLAGAPGTGKSVLMQTLITALLLENRPDELNLVLVDFKGGGAFLPFENCPHVTAVIRNVGDSLADTFSEADAARMLASVRAEVAGREAKLAGYGGEIGNYWRARETRPELERLPRVVFIFDEFAQLLDVSPEVPRTLVTVARKGRSLGVHLVFATQAMQGKLTPEMKNNIDLRISLRQNEPAESMEVLNAPDAVTIPGSLRGRGMLLSTKSHPRTPQAFQSGYLGDPPPAMGGSRLTARTLRWTDLGVEPPAPATDGGRSGPTDQVLVLRAIEEAGRRLNVPAPHRSLLPPLPASLPLERLAEHQTEAPPGTAVPLGLADHPDRQAQPAYFLDLAGKERLMVAGGPQSGRTTFARALITGLATGFRPDQVHFYVVERQPAGLAGYAALPHCGGVFSPAEPDRIRRLVGWLAAEVQRRAAGFEQDTVDYPVIVVAVDGWEQFENNADPALADVSLGPTLREVMAAGAPRGVHIVPIGGQSLLTGRLSGLCEHQLLLPFPNEDARRASLHGAALPPALPGRAVHARTGRHVQVCQPGTAGAELAAGLTAGYAAAGLDPARLPRKFPPLPSLVGVGELALPSPLPSPSWIPLGIGGPDLTTAGIDLFDAGPHVMLISGPQGAGRTTAIATVACLLSWHGIDVLALAAPRSVLGRMLAGQEGIRVLTAATFDDSELRSAVAPFGDHRYAVLVDDADRITLQAEKKGFGDSPTLPEEIARPAEAGHRALVIAADATPILSGSRKSFAKPANEALNNGTRLLLTPARRADARLLNMPLEPDQYFTRPAGRGYLATTGAPVLIQLATAVP